ncbi:MAG: hypothetical protein HZB91_13450 [Elusimicrobia bacterium]|nr:hypothetical protein [Elusimicrobiota bacterium]
MRFRSIFLSLPVILLLTPLHAKETSASWTQKAGAYFLRGEIRYTQNRAKITGPYFETAVKLDPRDADAATGGFMVMRQSRTPTLSKRARAMTRPRC